MLDTAHIDELKELGGREAKDELAKYATTFGITLKKTRSFDNMVADLNDALDDLANEPMPEENSGMTIAELIASAPQELLVDSPVVEHIEVVDVPVVVETPVPEPLPVVVETTKLEPVEVVEPDTAELPKNFSPSLHVMGSGATGYVTLPWWIYEWISKNPDWKKNPKSFPHAYGLDSLFSLIYYINRDGFVRIRETRNSSFVVLE